MKMGTHKACWWALLAIGAGGTALVFWGGLISSSGPIWVFGPFSLALVAAALVLLRHLYRLEPLPGPLQLSLADLIVASFLTGLFLAVAHALRPEYFLPWGATLSFVAGSLFVVGQSAAGQREIGSFLRRTLYALGFALSVFGAVGTGAFVVFLSAAFFGAEADSVLEDVFGLRTVLHLEESPGFLRIAVALLAALGVGLCFAARQQATTRRPIVNRRRALLPIGFLRIAFGALGAGCLVVLLIALRSGGRPGRTFQSLFQPEKRTGSEGLFFFFRAAMACLAAGLAFCAAARRRARGSSQEQQVRTEEPPEEPAAQSAGTDSPASACEPDSEPAPAEDEVGGKAREVQG